MVPNYCFYVYLWYEIPKLQHYLNTTTLEYITYANSTEFESILFV